MQSYWNRGPLSWASACCQSCRRRLNISPPLASTFSRRRHHEKIDTLVHGSSPYGLRLGKPVACGSAHADLRRGRFATMRPPMTIPFVPLRLANREVFRDSELSELHLLAQASPLFKDLSQ